MTYRKIDPSLLEGGITGMIMASYLQAVTPRLSLGIDAFWSRPAAAYPPELNVSYAARYKAADWMACGQIIPDRGVLEASYWRRLTEKVETGRAHPTAMRASRVSSIAASVGSFDCCPE